MSYINIIRVTTRMCNSRLGGRAYLIRWAFLGIWRVHLVAPVHTTEAHYHSNNKKYALKVTLNGDRHQHPK